jgi:hypothetical protein
MYARSFHRKMMVALLAFRARGNRFCVHRRRVVPPCRWMMIAQLRERLLRPAALARDGRGSRAALEFLLAKLARRKTERRNARLKCAESLKPLRYAISEIE